MLVIWLKFGDLRCSNNSFEFFFQFYNFIDINYHVCKISLKNEKSAGLIVPVFLQQEAQVGLYCSPEYHVVPGVHHWHCKCLVLSLMCQVYPYIGAMKCTKDIFNLLTIGVTSTCSTFVHLNYRIQICGLPIKVSIPHSAHKDNFARHEGQPEHSVITNMTAVGAPKLGNH